MSLFRCGALALGLALVALLFSEGRAEGQVRIQQKQIQIFPGRNASGPLLTAEVKDKLNLTAEQKEKVAQLEKEFEEKTKDAESKLREAREKLVKDRNREAIQKITEMVQAGQKVRGEYEDKVAAVLNDEQKKKYEEARKDTRRPGGIRALPIQPGQFLPIQRPGQAPGQLLPKDVQEKLNLTAEQKEKLEKIQKEYESKTIEVLTDEQKKQYDELKKQPARPNLRPIPRRPAGDGK